MAVADHHDFGAGWESVLRVDYLMKTDCGERLVSKSKSKVMTACVHKLGRALVERSGTDSVV